LKPARCFGGGFQRWIELLMNLQQVFENKFRGDIRFRGAAYLKSERVSISRVTADQVFGVVQDGVDFQTHLVRENGDLKMHCTCQTGDRPPAPCKHLWATILAVDARNLTTGSAMPGHVPPFVVETLREPSFDDYWDGDPRRDVYIPPPDRAGRDSAVYKPQLHGWRAQLQRLSETMHGDAAAASTSGAKEREVIFEIDAQQSSERRQLVVQTSQRQRRANGQWGKRKPLRLRPGLLNEIDNDDDRRILAYLAGGTPERPTWFTTQAESQAGANRYYVPFALAEIILPLMCATRRTVLMGHESEKIRPLTWDEGPPWELCLDVAAADEAVESAAEKDAEDDSGREPDWHVTGRLVRGDESRSLQDAALLVPGGFVVLDNRVCRLHDFDAFEWARLLVTEQEIDVPHSEGTELVDRLLDLPKLPRLDLPAELRLQEVQVAPLPHLTIHTPRGVRWQHERLQGEVSFNYDGTIIRSNSPQGAIVQRERGVCISRDREREEAAWNDAQHLGARRLAHSFAGRYDVEIPAKMLGNVVRGLIKQGWQIQADGKQVHQPANLNFEIKSGIDWFELRADANFEGRSVPFPELLSALARGDCTVRLSDG
jgi:hypothetical protein